MNSASPSHLSEMSENTTVHLTKFDGTNFQLWKFGITFLLESKDLNGIVDGSAEEPNKNEKPEDWAKWKKENSKAVVIILSSIEQSQHASLVACSKASEMWSKLLTLHEQKTDISKQQLWQQFYEFKVNAGESIAMQIVKIETIVKHLKDVEEIVSDAAVMSKIISSLPTKFSAFSMAWDSVEKTGQTIANLTARLIKEEARLTNSEDETSKLALQVQALQMELHRKSKIFERKIESKGDQNDIAQKKANSNCGYCKQKGHWWRECPKRKSMSSESAMICDLTALFTTSMDQDKHVWLSDSGASVHMTYHREWFSKLEPVQRQETVKVANNKIIQVVGVGVIDVEAFVDGKWVDRQITDVYYIPELRRNLLSVGALLKRGFRMVYENDSCEIRSRSNDITAVGQMKNGLFHMKIRVKKQQECNSATVNDTKLWHERLGHLNLQSLKETDKLNAVSGMQINHSTEFFCEACEYGKQACKSHPSSSRLKTSKPGEMVHSDLCGPMPVESPRGSRYFILFKDDCTGFRTVYFMRHKSEAFSKFKEYEALTYKQTGNELKILRSDNGTEYLSNSFQDFLREKGIIHQRSAPYTQQQNGKAEREIRTLVESARSMIFAKNVPTELWSEAINTAAYTLNRIVSKKGDETTAYEKWFDRKPTVAHIRSFGSTAYMQVPKQLRKKLDPKSRKLILVGYENNSPNYRLWDADRRKIEISSDVNFDEKGSQETDESSCSKQRIFDFILKFCEDVDAPTREELEDSGDESDQENGRQNENIERQEMLDQEVIVEREEIVENIRQGRNASVSDESIGEASENRYSLRDRAKIGKPNWFSWAANVVELETPEDFSQAMCSPQVSKWREAMKEEMVSLEENKTWTLVSLPKNKHAIDCKWVYRIKTDAKGNVTRYKARLVAKGYAQKEGIDYKETFAPVVRYDSIRLLLGNAAHEDMEIAQFDVKAAFLYGELDEEIYMTQPTGFEDKKRPDAVCKLEKSLYGLKQAPRCWNFKFLQFLKIFDFQQTNGDKCVFVGEVLNSRVFLALYVDDGLIISKSQAAIDTIVNRLKQHFQVTLDDATEFIGIEIKRNRERKTITLKQSGYIRNVLKRFNMTEANTSSIPADPSVRLSKEQCPKLKEEIEECSRIPFREAVGSLLFVATVTRPDILYAVNQASQFLTNWGQEHWTALKKIMRYLKKTVEYGITFSKSNGNCKVIGYTDADYAGNVDTRKSTSGYIFLYNKSPITWSSQQQRVVALSTTEAEYIALALGTQEALWLRSVLSDLNDTDEAIEINVDNQSAIKIANNPEYHKRTKHIDVRYHFVRDVCSDGVIRIKYIETKLQLADILTKPLAKQPFEDLRSKLNITE